MMLREALTSDDLALLRESCDPQYERLPMPERDLLRRLLESSVHIAEGHEDGCPEYVVGRCVLSRGRPPEELANIISAEYRRNRGD